MDKLFNLLYEQLPNKKAVCGIMGNLKAESALKTNNLQNSFEGKYGNDEDYTRKVNSKEISKHTFMYDSAGYGLAQWTYWSRKKFLYENTVEKGLSIDDLQGQVNTIIQELKNYKLYDILLSCKDVKSASDLILTQYEKPANQSATVSNIRAKYGEEFYAKYSSGKTDISEIVSQATILRDILNDFLKSSYN
ncbi:MAG: hypothetical protein KBT03_00485 [Bacteroidales bacterium]|nr:hypothetical protein [Candidatus Scybalousia scybalohippi]